MKKMRKSVKIALVSIVAVLCVLAIVLGCVFGLRKPEGSSLTPFQKLANEINNNAIKNSYEFEVTEGAPYIQENYSYSDVVSFGKNYFVVKEGDNFYFYAYKQNSDKTFTCKNLTLDYGKSNAKSFINPVHNDDYVFIISDFGSEIFTKAFYRLVYFGDFDKINQVNETPIYEFDATAGEGLVQDTYLKDNYFAINYLRDVDFVQMTYTSDVYFSELSKLTISQDDINKISAIYYENSRIAFDCFDNGFTFISSEKATIAYLTNDGFKTKEYSIVTSGDFISTEYKLNYLSSHKFLVTKIDYIFNIDDLNDLSVRVDVEENGKAVYANYSYTIFDFSQKTATEKEFKLESGYAKISIFHDNKLLNLDDSYYICQQKIAHSNILSDEFLSSYFNKDDKLVLSYSSNENEYVRRVGKNTFLTTERLISANNEKTTVYKFSLGEEIENIGYADSNEEENYQIIENFGITGDVFAITKGGFWGAMDIDGNILIDPDDGKYVLSFYNYFSPIINGYALVSDSMVTSDETSQTNGVENYQVYLFDAKNKANGYVTKIENFVYNKQLAAFVNGGFMLYLEKTDEQTLKLKVLGYVNDYEYEIVDYSINEMGLGGECFEISLSNGKKT